GESLGNTRYDAFIGVGVNKVVHHQRVIVGGGDFAEDADGVGVDGVAIDDAGIRRLDTVLTVVEDAVALGQAEHDHTDGIIVHDVARCDSPAVSFNAGTGALAINRVDCDSALPINAVAAIVVDRVAANDDLIRGPAVGIDDDPVLLAGDVVAAHEYAQTGNLDAGPGITGDHVAAAGDVCR